jgi:hypothetical protein
LLVADSPLTPSSLFFFPLAFLQGIAMTGSGKTAAFVLPMIVHIMDQPELQVGIAMEAAAAAVAAGSISPSIYLYFRAAA